MILQLKRLPWLPQLAGVLLLLTVVPGQANAAWYSVPEPADAIFQFGSAEGEALDPESINVLVWNVYKGGKASWSEDFNRLSRDKDVLMLQEGYLSEDMNAGLLETGSFLYNFATSFVYESNHVPTGVVTAATVAPTSNFFFRSHHGEFMVHTPKVVLYSEFPVEGSKKHLLTANIHALNFVSKGKLTDQLEGAMLKIKDYSDPVVFAGDFNTWNQGKLQAVRRIMQDNRFTEVEFSNGEDRTKIFGNIIDHVFVRDVEYTDTQVYADVKGSDHKPLELTLTLPQG